MDRGDDPVELARVVLVVAIHMAVDVVVVDKGIKKARLDDASAATCI